MSDLTKQGFKAIKQYFLEKKYGEYKIKVSEEILKVEHYGFNSKELNEVRDICIKHQLHYFIFPREKEIGLTCYMEVKHNPFAKHGLVN